jgi:ubiquitin-protein ligase
VKQGIFAGGIFKFIIEFPLLYPNQKPAVRFLSPVLHPLVDPNSHNLNLDVRINHFNKH